MANLQKIKHIGIGVIIGSLLTVSVSFSSNPIKLIINNKQIENAEAILIESRTYVPLRVIANNLEASVMYDSESNTVYIKSKDQGITGAVGSGPKPNYPVLVDPVEENKTTSILQFGETYDAGNIKITLYDLNYIEPHELIDSGRNDITNIVNYKMKIELDENTYLTGALWQKKYITENPKYDNTSILRGNASGTLLFGETKIFNQRIKNTIEYDIKYISVSIPQCQIENIMWQVK